MIPGHIVRPHHKDARQTLKGATDKFSFTESVSGLRISKENPSHPGPQGRELRFGDPRPRHRPFRLSITPRPAPPAKMLTLIGQRGLRAPPRARLGSASFQRAETAQTQIARSSRSSLPGSSGSPSPPLRADPGGSPLPPGPTEPLPGSADVAEVLSVFFFIFFLKNACRYSIIHPTNNSSVSALWQRDKQDTVPVHIKGCGTG